VAEHVISSSLDEFSALRSCTACLWAIDFELLIYDAGLSCKPCHLCSTFQASAMFTFSYNVTRPYPLRFFTAIIIVLFLIATIFLSFFNTIVTGYDLRVTYSTNPNATIARKMWYDKPVFKGIRKLSPSCEPKEIGVQQKFNTNKNGFIYSIDSITTMDQDGLLVPSPSMRYLNNTLENCTINYIKIEMAKELGRTAQQVAWSRWGPQLLAAISCFITNEQGHTQFDFTTDYDLIPPNANKRYDLTGGGRDQWAFAAQQKLYQFVVSNNTQNPAMWWAESLMSYGWLDASFKIEAADSAMKGDGKWQSGSISLYPLLPRQSPFVSLTHTPQTSAPIQTNRRSSLLISST
jgi:hypothetical protein